MTNELIMRIDEKWQIQEFQNFGGWAGVIEILVLSWRGVLFWYPFTHTLCFCSECWKYRLTWYIDFIESMWVLCSPNFQKQTLDPPLNIFIFDVADFTIVFTLWLGQGCNDVQWGAKLGPWTASERGLWLIDRHYFSFCLLSQSVEHWWNGVCGAVCNMLDFWRFVIISKHVVELSKYRNWNILAYKVWLALHFIFP